MVRCANLILHHRIANTLNQAAELSRVLGVAKQSLDISLPLQRGQASKNLLQFPANLCVSGSTLVCSWRVCAHRSSLILLFHSLISPSLTGSQSHSARSLARGANDSIACLFAFVRCGHVSVTDGLRGKVSHLAIFQDEAETSGNGLERAEGIRRVSHRAEGQFGRR